MRKLIFICTVILIASSCSKEDINCEDFCDIQKSYRHAESHATVTNGVWGTVSTMEGNCMPPIAGSNSGCRHCPARRVVKIYEYTTIQQAVRSGTSNVFFDSFNTQLIREISADSEGFFQVDLPVGQYTIVVVEDGKLYGNLSDGQGGINPFTFSGGKMKLNFLISYKAAF